MLTKFVKPHRVDIHIRSLYNDLIQHVTGSVTDGRQLLVIVPVSATATQSCPDPTHDRRRFEMIGGRDDDMVQQPMYKKHNEGLRTAHRFHSPR
ncbi:hypothetical protein J6590_003671 [Homalodisca vitripennis]|nr:hypothetical protein J6590_003671 [Homalodisca vitripennis]